MSEEEFHEVYAQMCAHIVKSYWPNETTAQVEAMAEMMETA
jgi:hypothetical protein